MKVKIDCDKRLRERGGTEYEGGWYHFTTAGPQQDVEWKSEARWPTYSEARRALLAAGHEHDNAGWRHRMLSWNFTSHSLDNYPGWEVERVEHGRPIPAFVKLTHTRGAGDVESHALAAAWDDIAEHDFYQRDWTDSGIPFVNGGETYWSGWWFATLAERDRFVRWHQERLRGC